jgi:hypothetical protein
MVTVEGGRGPVAIDELMVESAGVDAATED